MSAVCLLGDVLDYGRRRLGSDETARYELRLIVAALADIEPARQLAFPEMPLADEVCRWVRGAIDRRADGEPVAYILGYRDFWRHRFRVTPATLIPRPETEHLIEWALDLLPAQASIVADLGAGSGAIALSIAAERVDSRVLATDISTAALAVAAHNQRQMGLRNVLLLRSDWASGLGPRRFDLVVSNPPYIPRDDQHLRHGDLRFEPVTALASGSDGLDDFRRLIPQGFDLLKPGGWLLLEHGYDQAAPVADMMRLAGFAAIETRSDLAGQPRNTAGRKPV